MPARIMKTRQSPRKLLTVPGRYFTGKGQPVDVTLTDLSDGGCRFPTNGSKLMRGSHVQIYIAGTGPHQSSVTWSSDGETGVTFARPLEPELLSKFQNSHVPDAAASVENLSFDDMPEAPPRRFC